MLFQDYYATALRQGWFDPCFYFDELQSRGMSIQNQDLSLFEHFATIGWTLGLSPSERFSVESYLSRYKDVADSRIDPLYHYLSTGQRQQRQAFPLVAPGDQVQTGQAEGLSQQDRAGRVAEDLCVVIPSHNHEQFIVAALDSILAQSLRPREIRIIDDGSQDGSAELVRGLADAELGIFVEARDNRGAPATINQAVAETECPVIAVLNSDDRWHPLRIEELIGSLRPGGGADVVFSRVRFVGPRHRCEDKRSWYERGIADHKTGTPLWLALMFCNFFFTTSNLMARRDKFLELGGFGPFRYLHDLDYMLKAIFAGHKVQFVDQTLCDYRVHASNSIDESVHKVLFEEAWIVVKHLQQNLRRISEVEKLIVAQRVCDKGLATRVLGILRAASHTDSDGFRARLNRRRGVRWCRGLWQRHHRRLPPREGQRQHGKAHEVAPDDVDRAADAQAHPSAVLEEIDGTTARRTVDADVSDLPRPDPKLAGGPGEAQCIEIAGHDEADVLRARNTTVQTRPEKVQAFFEAQFRHHRACRRGAMFT